MDTLTQMKNHEYPFEILNFKFSKNNYLEREFVLKIENDINLEDIFTE